MKEDTFNSIASDVEDYIIALKNSNETKDFYIYTLAGWSIISNFLIVAYFVLR